MRILLDECVNHRLRNYLLGHEVESARFAGLGFKRQVPVGPHIADLVSFARRTVVDLVPDDESRAAAKTRAEKRAWLAERGYAIIDVQAGDVDADVGKVLVSVSLPERITPRIDASASVVAVGFVGDAAIEFDPGKAAEPLPRRRLRSS